MERQAQKARQERIEREALELARLQKLEEQRVAAEAKRKEEEEAQSRREAEHAKMMAEYAAKKTLEITDDAPKEELEVPLSAPVITITGEEGQTVSYPQRTFKPAEPKGEETVTLKTSGEIHDGSGRLADKAVLAGMGLAMTVMMLSRKSWLRSPVDAPDAEIALTAIRSDLEDPEPLSQSWAASAVDRALA